MKYLYFILIKTLINLILKCNASLESDILLLTSNFFSNLNSLEFEGNDFNDTLLFIDNQIDRYTELLETTHGLNTNLKLKRSLHNKDVDVLAMDFNGVHVLNGFFEQIRIPVINPLDIQLFKHEFENINIWYAATLQNLNKEIQLIIYKYEDEKYIKISNISLENASKIEVYTLNEFTYIVIADTSSVLVFIFDLKENLIKIQTLDVLNPSSIDIWQFENDIYMAVAQEIHDSSVIYKWSEKQFYIFQNIETNNARAIISFTIGNDKFLAVANYKNDKNEIDTFSEIYKYDVFQKQFVSYQKILTHAAVDIKYFCFKQNNMQEIFLIVANSYEKAPNGQIIYETNSIVYKYVENYFLPFQSFTLNRIEQWLPIVGINGEFLLLAVCKNSGIKAFQYDGWRFIESDVQYTKNSFGVGIKSIKSYIDKDEQLIVVANENDRGNMQNVLSPKFNYQNVMNEFQKGMQDWCQQAMKEFELINLDEVNKLVDEAPKIDDSNIELNGRLYFKNVTIYNLVLDDENIGINPRRVKKSNDIIHLEQQIDKKSEQLNNINEKLKNNHEPIILNGNVHVKNLEIDSDRIVFKDLQTETINKVKINEFYSDIFFLDDSLDLTDNIEFEDIIFDEYFAPKYVNNIPRDEFLYKSFDQSLSGTDLIVDGNIIIEDLLIDGYLDNISINETSILLIDGDQNFDGPIRIKDIETDQLNVNYINNINLIHLQQNRFVDIAEHNIETLSVKNITIGYINGMDMHSFKTLALNTEGDQIITGNYEFNTIIVNELQLEGLLSNIHSDNFTYTSNATNLVLQSLIFTEDLNAKNLYVMKRLKHIPVINAKLNVLLKDSPDMQFIKGTKTFETINLLGPIQLRGQIKIKGLDPPIITKKLNLEGDFTIRGDVVIEKVLKFKDLTEGSGVYSMNRLDNFGLKLTEIEIPIHLDFTKGLAIDKIQVDTINEIDVKSWIIFEDDIPKITGQKTFENDLIIYGNIEIEAINGINLKELYKNILKIEGDQTITGKHTYKNVSCIRAVSDKTLLNNIPWDTVMTYHDDQYINGTTLFLKPVKISQFEAKSATIKKNILGYNFNEMIADTLFNDTVKTVSGKKHFEEKISFQNLNIERINNADLKKLVNQINTWLGDIHIGNETVEIFQPIEVNSLLFEELNGLTNKEFGNVWLLRNGDQIIFEDQFFEKIRTQKVLINSNVINNVNIKKIDENSVKINEKQQFGSVDFVNPIKSQKSIKTAGKINNLDINDAILSNGLKNQTMFGNKILLNNFTVDGFLHVNGLLSGINLTSLKYFTDSNILEKNLNLIIDGNINFKTEFNVNKLNGHDIKEISKNAWYKDKKTKIQGFISFENIIFEDDITVDGYVDDIELVWLSKNYFSKTKNQTITAKLDFIDGIIFAKDLKAENALVSGLVANIKIQDFNRRILRNDDQIFDYQINIDDLEVTNFFESELINHLNLGTDVMRNDVTENIVTGYKIIKNVNAIDLDISEGKKIQNIDVDVWFKNAVTLNGSFFIDGLKTLKNAKFEENIELKGLLNSYKFDEEHILTTYTKQKITGKKNFITSGRLINSSLVFDILKLKGLINNIDIDKLVEKQIDKSKDTISISAKKNFFNNLIANNVNIKHLFQNVDVPSLIQNITNLQKVKNYEDEYKKLIGYTKNTLNILKRQSYFLKSYKQIQKISKKTQMIISITENQKTDLGFINFESQIAKVSIYTLDKTIGEFIFDKDYDFNRNSEISFISSINLNNKTHLYMEQESSEVTGFSHLGNLYELTTQNVQNLTTYFVATIGTKSVTSFNLPHKNKNCLLNIQNTEHQALINCEKTDNVFELHQAINIFNGLKASSIEINEIPYLFIISLGPNFFENSIEILKYTEDSDIFNVNQILPVVNAYSIDTICYNQNCYLVVGERHQVGMDNPGLIIIYKYNENTDKFDVWQKLNAMDPIEVKFNILTSQELVLYVLSNCPSEPLTIYQYNGIEGFKLNYIAVALPIVHKICPFSLQDNDFIAVSNNAEIRIMQALYKGKNDK